MLRCSPPLANRTLAGGRRTLRDRIESAERLDVTGVLR